MCCTALAAADHDERCQAIRRIETCISPTAFVETADFMRIVLFLLPVLLGLSAAQLDSYIPSWNGPNLHLWLPGGGVPAVKGTKWSRIYHAEPEYGTYNHACMIDAFNGSFIAYWKNSPADEDQPGQRVLWSYSSNGLEWTPTDGKNILFPNMSTGSNFHVALFAEPALHINGHQ